MIQTLSHPNLSVWIPTEVNLSAHTNSSRRAQKNSSSNLLKEDLLLTLGTTGHKTLHHVDEHRLLFPIQAAQGRMMRRPRGSFQLGEQRYSSRRQSAHACPAVIVANRTRYQPAGGQTL